ncbi:hypothetical protein PENTCL1PPCAC_14622, partial [Pristionchus entomophagus]
PVSIGSITQTASYHMANIVSVCLLLMMYNGAIINFSHELNHRKELRNPFNSMLSMMCLASLISLGIKASLAYRDLGFTILETDYFSEDRMTYSYALHTVMQYDTWGPFRSVYTWHAVILTFMRQRALRSKGKWDASYSLAFTLSTLIVLLSAAASIPLFMTNVITYKPLWFACREL